jgi:hypothetical protein
LGRANRERRVLVVSTEICEVREARGPVGKDRHRRGGITSGNAASILTDGTAFAGVMGS